MSFYNELSSFYDQMISFESRFENEKKIFKEVLNKYPAEAIIDAGCGSGYHSILLSSFEKEVTGFDPSEEMIKLARQNATKYQLKIDFFQTDFLDFTQKISKNSDALFSLGNSFVHLITMEDISNALKNFYGILNPGGYACFGIVNYDKVLEMNDLEISKKDKDGVIFHRYYTLNKKTVTFHVDISGKDNHHLETELYPLRSEDLKELALKAGFKNIELYGNLKLEKYIPEKSENIVAFLHK